MSKQDVVVEKIKEEAYSRKEVLAAAECTTGAFASYLSALRNAAKYSGENLCPAEEIREINGEEKLVMVFVSYAEGEESKKKKATGRPVAGAAVTPEKRLAAAIKRVNRTGNASTASAKRLAENTDDRGLQLRSRKADIEFELANIEHAQAIEGCPEGISDETDTSEKPETQGTNLDSEELM